MKEILSSLCMFICFIGMTSTLIMTADYSLRTQYTYGIYYAIPFVLFSVGLFLSLYNILNLQQIKAKKRYDKYENQDNADIAYVYENHPRVRIMKPEEDSLLLYINSKFWVHIYRTEDGFEMMTPPYKNVKRVQQNTKVQLTTALKNLPRRIM